MKSQDVIWSDNCFSTICGHAGDPAGQFAGAVVPPIFVNSLFTFPTIEAMREACNAAEKDCFTYTREGNPTVEVAEKKIAALEHAEAARLFSSGMAAITSAIMSCVKGGDHVICVHDVYPSSRIFITDYLSRYGVTSTVVSGQRIEEFQAAIRPETKLIYLESPTSLTFRLQDLTAVVKLAKAHGIRTAIDNTWATPIFQNPISMGVDLVIHSASKYLGGHSALVAGAVAGSKALISALAQNERMYFGGILGPFEAYVLTMGMRTLPLRMQRHQENALAVAQYLSTQKRVRCVDYPGLPTSPDYALACRQMRGFSGVMSFELDGTPADVARFVDGFKLLQIGVSWGGFESLIYAPGVMAAANQEDQNQTSGAFSNTRVRVSIGLEDKEDILRDFERAFTALG